MEDLLFEIKRGFTRMGLQIYQDKLIIQDFNGEETIIFVKSITSITTKRQFLDFLGGHPILIIQADEEYKLRGLSKKDCEKAKEVLVSLI